MREVCMQIYGKNTGKGSLWSKVNITQCAPDHSNVDLDLDHLTGFLHFCSKTMWEPSIFRHNWTSSSRVLRFILYNGCLLTVTVKGDCCVTPILCIMQMVHLVMIELTNQSLQNPCNGEVNWHNNYHTSICYKVLKTEEFSWAGWRPYTLHSSLFWRI